MDIIRILNLKIPAKHGVFDFEKFENKTFQLDIMIYKNLNNAKKTDKLEDTIDYSDVIAIANEVFTKTDYNLIEYAGGKICDRLFAEYSPDKVIVKVRKPHAPIEANFDTVEVEIERVR